MEKPVADGQTRECEDQVEHRDAEAAGPEVDPALAEREPADDDYVPV
jgi:hypothetical protein